MEIIEILPKSVAKLVKSCTNQGNNQNFTNVICKVGERSQSQSVHEESKQ